MAKNGDFYWVFAHVTPSYAANGDISGFHSNRRLPRRDAIEKVDSLYHELLAEENKHDDRKQGMNAGYDKLVALLKDSGTSYDEFVHSL